MKELRSGQRRSTGGSESRTAGSADRQASAARRPFAVFDIDGTLIRWQLYHAISDAFVKLDYVKPATYQIVKDARMEWKRRSGKTNFRDYELVLIEAYEQALKSLSRQQFLAAAEAVFDEYKDQVYTYPRKLIKDLKKRDYLLFAISGSQVEIVEKIAGYYGFDDWSGTVYDYRRGRFTGQKTVGSADKAATVKQLASKHSVTFKESLAIGDSHSDIAMLEIVETPVAFNPEKRLFERAQSQGWRVVLERKNMVFELESKNGRYQLAKATV